MIERGRGGHVVNLSSAAGVMANPELSAYSATKFAVFGLSEALRTELRPHGIGVTAVCPGLINTEITKTSPYPLWATRTNGAPSWPPSTRSAATHPNGSPATSCAPFTPARPSPPSPPKRTWPTGCREPRRRPARWLAGRLAAMSR